MERTTHFSENTPNIVRLALERARTTRKRIRLFYGDTERPDFEQVHKRPAVPGKSWYDENDVTGYVGRSTGERPIPLIIANNRSMGGTSILDGSIVRLFVDGVEVYRHHGYKEPVIRIEHENKHADVPWAATIEGEQGPWARFATKEKAERWAAFMRGERMAK